MYTRVYLVDLLTLGLNPWSSFSIYTHTLGTLMQTHGFNFHLYDDIYLTVIQGTPKLYVQLPTIHLYTEM